ncbi:flagellar biosynthetic protein FliR [Myxococcota bacterium]|nr:flagellar biosynthetic protein FliR [Myxococcota bacterium]
MDITADAQFWVVVLLVSIRVGAVMLFTPVFAMTRVPIRIQVMMTLGLAFMLTLGMNLESIPADLSLAWLFRSAALEILTGGLLAFGVAATFGAFLLGGRVLDFQLGFGVANLIDPATRAAAPLLGTLLNLAAVTTFFLVDGHHLLVRGLAYSLSRIPPGQGLADFDVGLVVAQFGAMFTFGIAVVAAPIFTLLLIDTAMAVAGRTMPQVNMFILGIPIKVLVGLSVLAITLTQAGPLYERIYTSIFTYWDAVIG